MNREDIIRMAREAGWPHAWMDAERLECFAALVADAEREECAKVVEIIEWPKWAERGDERGVLVDAIRARGQA